MKRILILSLSVLALSACESKPKLEDAQYWQRADSTSALYMQGPKAQQNLHKDISGCVAEVNELARLGTLRNAVPKELETPDESELAEWDTPQKDSYLGADHSDFVDFETCMRTKGWERVEHLPYDVSTRARKTWLKTIKGDTEEKAKVNATSRPKDREPFEDLND